MVLRSLIVQHHSFCYSIKIPSVHLPTTDANTTPGRPCFFIFIFILRSFNAKSFASKIHVQLAVCLPSCDDKQLQLHASGCAFQKACVENLTASIVTKFCTFVRTCKVAAHEIIK